MKHGKRMKCIIKIVLILNKIVNGDFVVFNNSQNIQICLHSPLISINFCPLLPAVSNL